MSVAAGVGTTGTPTHGRARSFVVRWRLALAGLAVSSPLVVVAARVAAAGHGAPGGDLALIELRVRDVPAHLPLVGSYGRYGFNHPGPLWFYLLAIPYRLAGAHYAGMQLGTLALGVASIAACLWVAHRRGGAGLLSITALALALLVRGFGPWWVADPWEPHALTLPCAALLFLTADAALGGVRAVPLVGVIASLVAQAQATLATFGVAMGMIAVVGCALYAVRDERGNRRRRVGTIGITALLVVILWTPVVVDQMTSHPGNLSAMARSLGDARATLGVALAWRTVASQVGLRPPWLGFGLPLMPFSGVVAPPGMGASAGVLAVVGATVVAAWRRWSSTLALGLVALCATVTATVSLARLIGPLFLWIPEWTRVIGMVCAVVVADVVCRAAVGVVGWWRGHTAVAAVARSATIVACVGVSVLAVGSCVAAATTTPPRDPIASSVGTLVARARPALAAADEPLLAKSTVSADLAFGGGDSVALESLVLALERAGHTVVVSRDLGYRFGDHRARPDRARTEVRLAGEGADVPTGFARVASVDLLTPKEHAIQRRVLARLPGKPSAASLADVVRTAAVDRSLAPLVEEYAKLPPLSGLSLFVTAPQS